MRRLATMGAIVLAAAACAVAADSTSTTSTSVASTTTSTTTTSTIPPTTTTTVPPTTLPAFPPQWEGLTHGGDAWAVILHISEGLGEDPGFTAAREAAEAAGYVAGETDCDRGVAEAAGLPPDGQYYSLSVYFETEAIANEARDAFLARGVDTVVGLVQTYCMD